METLRRIEAEIAELKAHVSGSGKTSVDEA